jgi:hypothetical protein
LERHRIPEALEAADQPALHRLAVVFVEVAVVLPRLSGSSAQLVKPTGMLAATEAVANPTPVPPPSCLTPANSASSESTESTSSTPGRPGSS